MTDFFIIVRMITNQNPFPPTIMETKKIPGSVCLPCLSKHSINAPKKVPLFKWERFPQFITWSALLMGVIKEATAIQQKSTIEDKGRETFPSIHFLRQHLVCDITFQMGVCVQQVKRANIYIYIFFLQMMDDLETFFDNLGD